MTPDQAYYMSLGIFVPSDWITEFTPNRLPEYEYVVARMPNLYIDKYSNWFKTGNYCLCGYNYKWDDILTLVGEFRELNK